MDLERRLLGASAAQLRLAGDAGAQARTLVGYAARFNSESEDLGGWREVLAPGAFSRALRERQDTVALVNHNADLLLGRVANGSLELAEDSQGLRVKIHPPDTAAAREALALVKGGFAGGMSFAFVPTREGIRWRDDARGSIREVSEIERLIDVSVITGTRPAYSATSISARGRQRASVPSLELARLRLLIS